MGKVRAVKLVKVAYANDRAEAELIQGLLEDQGIPSVCKNVGIEGPMLGIGLLPTSPHRVLVAEEDADRALAVLEERVAAGEREAGEDLESSFSLSGDRRHKPRDYGVIGAYVRMYAAGLAFVAFAFVVFLLLRGG